VITANGTGGCHGKTHSAADLSARCRWSISRCRVCVRRADRRCAYHQNRNHIQGITTFGGYTWREVGQYEKLVGKAVGELDPTDPKNSVIVDILLAPKNARGRVEYSFDFYILKPVDLSKGAHKVVYEPPKRGSKTWAALERATSEDLPDSPFARTYLMSSMQHGTGNAAVKGACQQFLNPLDASPVLRALFVALDVRTKNEEPTTIATPN
jgi:hypothetical protein